MQAYTMLGHATYFVEYWVPEKVKKAKRACEIIKSNQIHKNYRGQRNEGGHTKVRLGILGFLRLS